MAEQFCPECGANLKGSVHALHASAERMKEALGFYANRENYQRQLVSDVLMSEMDVDEGHAARAALAGKGNND